MKKIILLVILCLSVLFLLSIKTEAEEEVIQAFKVENPYSLLDGCNLKAYIADKIKSFKEVSYTPDGEKIVKKFNEVVGRLEIIEIEQFEQQHDFQYDFKVKSMIAVYDPQEEKTWTTAIVDIIETNMDYRKRIMIEGYLIDVTDEIKLYFDWLFSTSFSESETKLNITFRPLVLGKNIFVVEGWILWK